MWAAEIIGHTILQLEFPQTESQPARPIEEGVNDVFHIRTEYQHYVLKLYPFADVDRQKDHLVGSEVLKRIQPRTFTVPSVYSNGQLDTTAYAIFEFVEGEVYSVDNLYNEPKEFFETYIQTIASILAEIHTLDNPVDSYGWFTLTSNNELCINEPYNSGGEMAYQYLDYVLDGMDSLPVSLSPDELKSLVESKITDTEPRLVHSDLKYENVIVSSSDYAIIDWEYVHSGSAMFDFVKADRMLFSRYDYEQTDVLQNLREIFRDEYFTESPITFNSTQFRAFQLLEYCNTYTYCEEWYPHNTERVKDYYSEKIEQCIQLLQ
jgi:aminoglycoside phosphotransferase (APT) family kinase protein